MRTLGSPSSRCSLALGCGSDHVGAYIVVQRNVEQCVGSPKQLTCVMKNLEFPSCFGYCIIPLLYYLVLALYRKSTHKEGKEGVPMLPRSRRPLTTKSTIHSGRRRSSLFPNHRRSPQHFLLTNNLFEILISIISSFR